MGNTSRRDRLNAWLRVIPWEQDNAQCPDCGEKSLDYEFVGDLEKRMGYCLVWCNACESALHISRTRVPDNIPMLSFSEAESNLGKAKPKDLKFIS